jgi:hypothetical protein
MNKSYLFKKLNKSIKNGHIYLDDGRIIDRNNNLIGFYDTNKSIDETCRKFIIGKINNDYISENEFQEFKNEFKEFFKLK